MNEQNEQGGFIKKYGRIGFYRGGENAESNKEQLEAAMKEYSLDDSDTDDTDDSNDKSDDE